jgi:hypothetical protein
MCSEVISARISKKDKETLREAGIDISLEIRRHLEQVAAEVRAERALDRLNKTIEKFMTPARKGYSQRSVREDRESH